MNCLFCCTETDSKKVDKKTGSYICGTCVQTMLNLSHEKLRHAYNLAVKEGNQNKAKALKSFVRL